MIKWTWGVLSSVCMYIRLITSVSVCGVWSRREKLLPCIYIPEADIETHEGPALFHCQLTGRGINLKEMTFRILMGKKLIERQISP